eukprot:UN34531
MFRRTMYRVSRRLYQTSRDGAGKPSQTEQLKSHGYLQLSQTSFAIGCLAVGAAGGGAVFMLTQQASEIDTLNKTVASNNKQMEADAQTIEAKSNSISKLEGLLEDARNRIAEKDSELDKRAQTIRQKDKSIAHKAELIKKKENVIRRKDNVL